MAAAAFALSLAASQAQTVYSKNVVGYITMNLQPGFNLIANQLDYDGTGTNNTVQTVFGTSLVSGDVYPFVGGGFTAPATYSSKFGWQGDTNDANAALQPGGGVFVLVGSPTTITMVGQVIQGTNNYAVNINPGFNIISGPDPLRGGLTTTLGLTPAAATYVYQWDPVAQSYVSPASSYSTKFGWNGLEPQLGTNSVIGLSEAIFFDGAAQVWENAFTVQ
jgi:hypothetical protein